MNHLTPDQLAAQVLTLLSETDQWARDVRRAFAHATRTTNSQPSADALRFLLTTHPKAHK